MRDAVWADMDEVNLLLCRKVTDNYKWALGLMSAQCPFAAVGYDVSQSIVHKKENN